MGIPSRRNYLSLERISICFFRCWKLDSLGPMLKILSLFISNLANNVIQALAPPRSPPRSTDSQRILSTCTKDQDSAGTNKFPCIIPLQGGFFPIYVFIECRPLWITASPGVERRRQLSPGPMSCFHSCLW